jgi:hypothetical protein
MIYDRAFISRLPQNLATSIQDQYNDLLPIFTKYAQSEGNQYYTFVKSNYEVSCFFLEMALFYKSVIVPMSSGANAFVGFTDGDISTVRVGNFTLTDADRRMVKSVVRDFDTIMIKYQIPTRMLLFSDVKNFARDLNGFLNPSHE